MIKALVQGAGVLSPTREVSVGVIRTDKQKNTQLLLVGWAEKP
jgi:hypothetical protein